MDVFKTAGLEVELLAEFAQFLKITLDDSLHNIWIAHKCQKKRKEVLKEINNSTNAFYSPKFQISETLDKDINPKKILKAITKCFKKDVILSYIFESCFLLHKRQSSHGFEPLHPYELNSFLLKFLKASITKKRQMANAPATSSAKRRRSASPDIFLSDEVKCLEKVKRLRAAKKKNLVPKIDSSKIMISTCLGEKIVLDTILYDWKQRPVFLTFQTEEHLLKHVIQIPVSRRIGMLDEWYFASSEWVLLKKIFQTFINENAKISHKNGYGRILKKHLRGTQKTNNLKVEEWPVDKKNVISYVCDILKRVLSKDLFGTNRARKKFFSAVNKLVYGTKFQSFGLECFLQCFEPKPSWCLQLAPFFQHYFLMKLVKFLVVDLILGLLKKSFYITESGSSGIELFYYRKNYIERVINLKKQELVNAAKISLICKSVNQNDCFEKRWLQNNLTNDETEKVELSVTDFMSAANEYAFPTAKVRFLPKSKSRGEFRAITIKPRRCTGAISDKLLEQRCKKRMANIATVNRFLEGLLAAVGTGIQPANSNPELLEAWKKVSRLKKEQDCKLFFVKADIIDAFGSINHSRLFEMLDRVCPPDPHLWTQWDYREWVVRRGKLQITNRSSFSTKVLRNRVLHSRIPRQDKVDQSFMKEIIRQVVSQQRILIGNEVFIVTRGLCQGGVGVLSTRLCDFYYSAFDVAHFNAISNTNESVLLRGTDDYLFVTTNREAARMFYSVICKGSFKYNTYFNQNKLKTNLFEDDFAFTYLGMKFDVESLNVTPCYDRFINSSPLSYMKLSFRNKDPRFHAHSFLVERGLKMKMLKLEPIVLNSESDINHARSIVLNGCWLETYRTLAIALYVRPTLKDLLHVLNKAAVKLEHQIIKKTNEITREEIKYIFWQNVYGVFKKYSGNFMGLNANVQKKLLLIYGILKKRGSMFENIHEEIEENFEKNIAWWCPWKK